MPRGIASKTYTPIRIVQGQTLAWCATGERERGLPVYRLKAPTVKDHVLRFPMGGNAKGCIQVMENPHVR